MVAISGYYVIFYNVMLYLIFDILKYYTSLLKIRITLSQ
jgi:hypothetical protein